MRRFTADFETNVDEKDCRVWAWALYEIGKGDESFNYGNTIDSFIEWCKTVRFNPVVYFHNLRSKI